MSIASRKAVLKRYYLKNKKRLNEKAMAWARANLEKTRMSARAYQRRKNGFGEAVKQKSSAWVGRKWELFVLDRLDAVDANAGIMGNEGFDIVWRGKKINVKSRTATADRGRWPFHANSKNGCDFFLCLCLVYGKMKKSYLIPSTAISGKYFTIGVTEKGRFEAFLFKL